MAELVRQSSEYEEKKVRGGAASSGGDDAAQRPAKKAKVDIKHMRVPSAAAAGPAAGPSSA